MSTKKLKCAARCENYKAGSIHLGIPGILASINIERCDTCKRFKTDTEALRYFKKLLKQIKVK